MTIHDHIAAIGAAKGMISKAREMIPHDLDDSLNNSIDHCSMAMYFINEYTSLHIASPDKSEEDEGKS